MGVAAVGVDGGCACFALLVGGVGGGEVEVENRRLRFAFSAENNRGEVVCVGGVLGEGDCEALVMGMPCSDVTRQLSGGASSVGGLGEEAVGVGGGAVGGFGDEAEAEV